MKLNVARRFLSVKHDGFLLFHIFHCCDLFLIEARACCGTEILEILMLQTRKNSELYVILRSIGIIRQGIRQDVMRGKIFKNPLRREGSVLVLLRRLIFIYIYI